MLTSPLDALLLEELRERKVVAGRMVGLRAKKQFFLIPSRLKES